MLKPNSERGDALGQPPSSSQPELLLSRAGPRPQERTGRPLLSWGCCGARGVVEVATVPREVLLAEYSLNARFVLCP